MKTLRLLLLGGGIVAVAFRAFPVTPAGDARDYTRELPATLESDEVFLKRVELELRRAGGPRRAALAELLAVGRDHSLPSWGWALNRACEARAADCNDYLKYLSSWVAHQDLKQRSRAEGFVESIRLEATLQAMSPGERRDLYLKVIKEGYVHLGPALLDHLNVSIRALQEGMLDLVPAIQGGNVTWQNHAVERQLIITKTQRAKDPVAELQKLVVGGVNDESPRLTEGDTSLTEATRLAVMAVGELRRVNPSGGAQLLRGSLDQYENVKRRLQDRLKGQVRPVAYLGELGWQIAEAVGDLGDRASERQALGGHTLWDQVHDVEERLVKEQKIAASAMIASTSR
jgi:hypothetical protein